MTTINVQKDFTRTPGARFISDGIYSGEEFRKTFLEPLFEDNKDTSKIHIILDGTAGYATSFLEESFGGLARKYGEDKCLSRLIFVSVEEKTLPDEINYYIKHAKDQH